VPGLDRKAIPKDLALSYRRSAGNYQDLRGRLLRSKPLLHRDAAIEAVASRFEASLTKPIVVDDDAGVLRLTLDAAATMPVAAVDGEPVAIGDGTVFVVLPTGRHVVEVQGGATSSPIVVEIGGAQTSTLVWREEADRATVRFGPEVVDAMPPASPVYLYQWAVAVFILCGLPLATVNVFSWGETASRATVIAVAIIGAALVPFVPWRRRERARIAAVMAEREKPGQPPVVHYPWDGPALADRPALLGERPEALPELAPGQGALLLRSQAHRHLWKGGDGVTGRDTELAGLRVEAPRVRVDGLEQPATWGNWWYPLRPGPHTVEIAVAAPTGGAAPVSERIEIEVRAGEATAARARAHVFTHRGEDGRIVAEESLLYFEPEAFQGEWMGDPGKRLEYWG
jgi:hypothetical protein